MCHKIYSRINTEENIRYHLVSYSLPIVYICLSNKSSENLVWENSRVQLLVIQRGNTEKQYHT